MILFGGKLLVIPVTAVQKLLVKNAMLTWMQYLRGYARRKEILGCANNGGCMDPEKISREGLLLRLKKKFVPHQKHERHYRQELFQEFEQAISRRELSLFEQVRQVVKAYEQKKRQIRPVLAKQEKDAFERLRELTSPRAKSAARLSSQFEEVNKIMQELRKMVKRK